MVCVCCGGAGWGVCVVGVLGGVCVLWDGWGMCCVWDLCLNGGCVRLCPVGMSDSARFCLSSKLARRGHWSFSADCPTASPIGRLVALPVHAQSLRVAGDERVMCAAVGDTCRAWSAAHLLGCVM